jgi:hypothetical protein
MRRGLLSKSDLLSFLQCARRLWLEKHRPDLIPPADANSLRRIADGNLVGQKARAILGAFVWPASAADVGSSVVEAWKQIDSAPDRAAVEVPMSNGPLYARADAILPSGSGYVLRETKSSTFPLKPDKATPASPDSHYLDDLAIQAWAFAGSGRRLVRSELNLLNNRWIYAGNGDYSGLFRQLDVSGEVAERMAEVPDWIVRAQSAVTGDMPAAMTGAHCRAPVDCPFSEFCTALEPPGPEHPIELLPDSAGKKLAKKLKEQKGYESLLQPAEAELTGSQSDLYKRIQRAHRTGTAILKPGCAEILGKLPYPRYYHDFEGIALPVPRWKGTRAYEQIPFQWSCHIERADGTIEQESFLDLSGNDPSLACIARLRNVIDEKDGGPLIVYHATYEKGRLKELGERHPEHAALMSNYLARIFDLLPLVKMHFYHPAMEGSFSIKKVLPVIAPDLDYGSLQDVQDGTDAQLAYIRAAITRDVSEEEVEVLRTNLLRYCEQDTWAMVEIAYYLAGRERPARLD